MSLPGRECKRKSAFVKYPAVAADVSVDAFAVVEQSSSFGDGSTARQSKHTRSYIPQGSGENVSSACVFRVFLHYNSFSLNILTVFFIVSST